MKPTKKEAPGSAGRAQPSPEDAVAQEIEALNGLGVAPLRELWSRRFAGIVPKIQSADILRRLMAWKVQVEAFGDLDPQTKARLRQLMRAQEKGASLMVEKAPRLKAGTTLVREWKGVEHRVLVLDAGFDHDGTRYRSLSEVARAIAGTRWSGPRFFGLEPTPGASDRGRVAKP